MMPFENGPGEIVEVALSGLASVSLTLFLGGIEALLEDVFTTTKWAAHSLWPTQLADFPVTICILDQILNVDHTTAHSRFYHEGLSPPG